MMNPNLARLMQALQAHRGGGMHPAAPGPPTLPPGVRPPMPSSPMAPGLPGVRPPMPPSASGLFALRQGGMR